MKIIKFLIIAPIVIIFVSLKLFFKLIGRTIDLGSNATQSVQNSQNFSEAYKNFTSKTYAKSRLSLPEEVIALMAKIAKSDGKVSEVEVEFMSDTIKAMVSSMQQAKVPEILIQKTKKKLFNLANQAKNDDRPISYYCYALSRSVEGVRVGAFLQLVAFASLDGFSENTLNVLNEVGETLKFPPEKIQQMRDQVLGSGAQSALKPGQDPYEVLGCEEDDEFAKIKKSYRMLVKKYHPDYMHGKGLDDNEIKKATEKMKEVNAAYEEVKKRTGKK